MRPTVAQLKKEIRKRSNPKRAKSNAWFFKTGKGEYGEGDRFLGVISVDMRAIAKKYRSVSLSVVRQLLKSPYHEDRQIALLILVEKYIRGTEAERQRVYRLYLASTSRINNWDLVDCSAYKIIGEHLLRRSTTVLDKLATSESLWERRIAIIATFQFIAHNRFREIFRIARLLLHDKEDLMHKAAGWMLREVGKKSLPTLEAFLKKNYTQMPRTMLRYAIEKFPEKQRQEYLKGNV